MKKCVLVLLMLQLFTLSLVFGQNNFFETKHVFKWVDDEAIYIGEYDYVFYYTDDYILMTKGGDNLKPTTDNSIMFEILHTEKTDLKKKPLVYHCRNMKNGESVSFIFTKIEKRLTVFTYVEDNTLIFTE